MLNKKSNFFFALMLGGSFLAAVTITSCNNDGDTKDATKDSTLKKAVDTTMKMMDSTKKMVDSTTKATVDTVKKMMDAKTRPTHTP
jgi:hypothetical protein